MKKGCYNNTSKQLIRFFISFYLLLLIGIPAFANTQSNSINKRLSLLENKYQGRLGIAAINTGNNQRINYHANEHFPFGSTAKVIAVSAILKKSENEPALLHKKILFTKSALIVSGYAPITQKHLSNGMNISELCKAAIEYSDNAAMNLLIKQLGSPKAVTQFARGIGNQTFRLDRMEPQLNSAIPGDLRDTATPQSMASSLKKLVLGGALALPERQQLKNWLIHNTTGNNRIRAAVSNTWVVGDKTGTGDYGTTNDIAIIWPPKCKPLVLAVYFTQHNKNATPSDTVIATATQLIIQEFAQRDHCIQRNSNFK